MCLKINIFESSTHQFGNQPINLCGFADNCRQNIKKQVMRA